MFKISIDIYTLIGILSIVVLLLIAIILIFIAYMSHDKRKYASIDKFNEKSLDKSRSYNENLKEYKENMEKSGVNHNKKYKLKTFQTIIKFLKRGSK